MALNNGWIKIVNDSGMGNATIAAEILERNTGRSVTRTATVVGRNAHNAEATAVFVQEPSPLFIIVDHFEDENGAEVSRFDSSYTGDCYIVGYANVSFLTISETSAEEYTDMNDMMNNTTWHDGFILTAADGSEDRIALESNITYGTDARYMFKIAFHTSDNKGSEREINFMLEDDDGTQTTAMIKQMGVST